MIKNQRRAQQESEYRQREKKTQDLKDLLHAIPKQQIYAILDSDSKNLIQNLNITEMEALLMQYNHNIDQILFKLSSFQYLTSALQKSVYEGRLSLEKALTMMSDEKKQPPSRNIHTARPSRNTGIRHSKPERRRLSKLDTIKKKAFFNQACVFI